MTMCLFPAMIGSYYCTVVSLLFVKKFLIAYWTEFMVYFRGQIVGLTISLIFV